MRHSRPSRSSWTYPYWHGLLGDFGKPLVPLWWAESLGNISSTYHYRKRNKVNASTRSLRSEIENPLLATVGVHVDFEQTFTSLGEQIADLRNDFLDAAIGNSNNFLDCQLVGSDLPLHVSYVDKFDELNLGATMVSEISGIPIEYFLEHGFSWCEVADISYTLSHGIDNVFGYLTAIQNREIHTLDESATLMVDELWLRDGGRLDDERLFGIQQRYGIGVPAETLETIGKTLGVTRERIRQIEGRFTPYFAQRRWPITHPMNIVLQEILETDSSEMFENALVIGLSNSSIEWDRTLFERLLRTYGQLNLLESIRGIGEPLQIDSEFSRRFRKHRNKIGFIDLRTFINNEGELEDPKTVFKYVQQIYKFSYKSGDIALASDSRGTQAQNAVEKQFAVGSPISGHELVEGIDRLSRNRGYGDLPPTHVVLDLLKQAGTINEVEPGVFTGEPAEIDGDLKKFLVHAIKNAPGGVANQPELFRQAVVEGFNTSSLVSYLTYEPMIRKFEGGLVRLAGSNPTPEAIDDAKRAALLQTEKGSIIYTTSTDGVISVTCVLGTTNLNSGVMSPSSALRAILDPAGYSIYCCEDSEFNGQIKLSSTLWYGFQPLFNHMRHNHGIKDGDVVKFNLLNNEMRLDAWN